MTQPPDPDRILADLFERDIRPGDEVYFRGGLVDLRSISGEREAGPSLLRSSPRPSRLDAAQAAYGFLAGLTIAVLLLVASGAIAVLVDLLRTDVAVLIWLLAGGAAGIGWTYVDDRRDVDR